MGESNSGGGKSAKALQAEASSLSTRIEGWKRGEHSGENVA